MEDSLWRSSATDYTPEERIRLVKGAALLTRALEDRQPPVDILDVGCGCGPMHAFLPRERFRITGIEMHELSAETASKNYASVVTQDITEAWPFENNSFDGILALAVLEHVVDYNSVLAEVSRLIKPGGCFIVEVPNLGYWKEVRRLLRRKQPHWLKQYDHVRGWTMRYLEDILKEHGFLTVHRECDQLNLPLLPSISWLERGLASWGRVLILQLTKRD